MSSIIFNSQDLNVRNQSDKIIYSPQKATTAAVLGVFEVIGDFTFKKIKEVAQQKVGNQTSFSPFFSVKPYSAIDLVSKDLTDSLNDPKKQIELLSIYSKIGIGSKELILSVNLAQKIATKFFSENPMAHAFSYSSSKQDVENQIIKSVTDAANFAYVQTGLKRDENPVSFTEEELKAFQVDRSHINIDPTKMSCLMFALKEVKELQAKELIFKERNHDNTLKNLFNSLDTWGYKCVDAPQAGDLAIYLLNGKPQHIGVYTETGKVHSKLGVNNPYSHTHSLFSIPIQYGTEVVFFRK